MHKQDFTRIALAVCCTFALAAHAQGTPRPTTGLSAADAKFVHEAAMGGMEEVELGKLAQQNASNDDVKKFGSRMVDDHSKANDKLKSVAGSKGVALPTSLDSKAQGDVNKLAKSKNFDRDYMDMMVKDHKKDVADFQKQAKSGKDSDVKEFAASTLPTLQEHLKMAQDTDKTVKMAKK